MSRVPWYLGYLLGTLNISLTGLSPTMAGLSRPLCYVQRVRIEGPATPIGKPTGLDSSPFARRYSENL